MIWRYPRSARRAHNGAMMRLAPMPALAFVTALALFAAVPAGAQQAEAQQEEAQRAAPVPPGLELALEAAEALEPLKVVIVAQDGVVLAERAYGRNNIGAASNIKSASKSIISALVGIAIDKGVLEGPDQRVAPLLDGDLPADPDPRLFEITIGHLLSMQAGLDRTSGQNYGRWVTSPNWVRHALARPFVAEPGGPMLYSTGSTHLLSAILTRATGRSTRDLARDWLGPLPGFTIGGWDRDPQGIYMGGNQMAMSARSLLAFGELYRNGGHAPDGTQLLSPEWIEASWTPRTASRFTGDSYGYGWYVRRLGGVQTHYAWGYGGQMLYIAPELGLTVAILSDDSAPSGRTGYRAELHALYAVIADALRTPAEQDHASRF